MDGEISVVAVDEILGKMDFAKAVRILMVITRLQARFRGRVLRHEVQTAYLLYEEYIRRETDELRAKEQELELRAAVRIQAMFRGSYIRHMFRRFFEEGQIAVAHGVIDEHPDTPTMSEQQRRHHRQNVTERAELWAELEMTERVRREQEKLRKIAERSHRELQTELHLMKLRAKHTRIQPQPTDKPNPQYLSPISATSPSRSPIVVPSPSRSPIVAPSPVRVAATAAVPAPTPACLGSVGDDHPLATINRSSTPPIVPVHTSLSEAFLLAADTDEPGTRSSPPSIAPVGRVARRLVPEECGALVDRIKARVLRQVATECGKEAFPVADTVSTALPTSVGVLGAGSRGVYRGGPRVSVVPGVGSEEDRKADVNETELALRELRQRISSDYIPIGHSGPTSLLHHTPPPPQYKSTAPHCSIHTHTAPYAQMCSGDGTSSSSSSSTLDNGVGGSGGGAWVGSASSEDTRLALLELRLRMAENSSAALQNVRQKSCAPGLGLDRSQQSQSQTPSRYSMRVASDDAFLLQRVLSSAETTATVIGSPSPNPQVEVPNYFTYQ